jgi:transglutaminase-like putative cysteine protease
MALSAVIALVSVFALSCATGREIAAGNAENRDALALGWERLWADDFQGAIPEFSKAAEDPSLLPRAQRGLVLAHFALDEQSGSLRSAALSVEADPRSAYSIALREWAEDTVSEGDFTKDGFGRIDAALIGRSSAPWARRAGARNAMLDLASGAENKGATNLKTFPAFDALLSAATKGVARAISAAEDANEFSKFRTAMGVVTGWEFLGPFPDTGGRGTGKAFIDEAKAAAGEAPVAPVLGAERREVAWFKPRSYDADGNVSPAEYLGGSNAAYYARAKVDSPEASDYWLVMDRSCAVKAWVAGKAVLEDSVPRDGRDMHWLRVGLSKGPNVILLKVSDRRGNANFRLSLVKADRDEGYDAALRGAVAALPGIEIVSPDPLIGSIAARLDPASEEEARFWLAYSLLEKGQPWAALAQAESLAVKFGKPSSLLSYLKYRAYSAAGREPEAKSALAEPLGRGVGFAPSLAAAAFEALGQERDARARELLESFPEPMKKGMHHAEISVILRAREKGNDAFADLKAFRSKYPGNYDLDFLLIERNGEGMDMGLLLNGLPKAGYQLETASALSSIYHRYGYLNAAWPVDSNLKRWRGGRAQSWINYLGTGMGTNSLTLQALEDALDEARSSYPRNEALARMGLEISDSVLASMRRAVETSPGTVSAELRTKENARQKDFLESVHGLEPADHVIRDRVRVLKGQKEMDEVVSLPDMVRAVEEHRAEKNSLRGPDGTLILEKRIIVNHPDGGYRIMTAWALEVNSALGVKNEGTQVLEGFDPRWESVRVDQAFAMRPDGTTMNPDGSGNRLSFPGLKAGDAIVVSYTVDGAIRGELRGEFWAWSRFNGSYPIEKKELVVAFAKRQKPVYGIHNDPSGSIVIGKGSLTEDLDYISFMASRVKAFKPDPGADWRDAFAWVDVSSVEGWDRIGAWYADLAEGRADPGPYLKARAEKLVAGAASRREKVKRLYDFVSKGIRYEDLNFQYSAQVPQWAESVLDDNYGDCKDKSALLIALLRAAGIEAHFCLSDTTYKGDKAFLPSTRFNHAIVAVPGGADGYAEEALLLDPTAEFYTFLEFPDALAGTHYLVATEKGAALKKVGTPRGAATSFFLAVKAGKDRDDARGTIVFHGDSAGVIRSITQSADKVAGKVAFRDLLALGLPGARISTFDVQAADSLNAAPVALFTANLPGVAMRGISSSWVEVPWPAPVSGQYILEPAGKIREGGGSACLGWIT